MKMEKMENRIVKLLLNISKSTVKAIIIRYRYEDRIEFISQKSRLKILDTRHKKL